MVKASRDICSIACYFVVVCINNVIALRFNNAKTVSFSTKLHSTLEVENPKLTSASTTLWDRQSWEKGYTTCKKETCETLKGLPDDIEGTYFRNGYAKFETGKTKLLHMFDGDGMISAVTIKDGLGTFRNSFVRTNGFKNEKKTRRVSARGTFGNHKAENGLFGNFLNTKLKNVANTNIIYFGNRLLALWEGGLPYKLEPDSLRTLGEYTFKGTLKKKGGTFTAHPRFDPLTNRMIGFSAANEQKQSAVTVIEFDDDLKVMQSRVFQVPGLAFFHDFVITKNYYIFSTPQLDFDPLPFLLGSKVGILVFYLVDCD